MTCSSFLKGSCWKKEVRKRVEGRRKHRDPAGERRSVPGPFLLAWEAGGGKCFLLLQSPTRRSSSPCVRKAFTQPGQ